MATVSYPRVALTNTGWVDLTVAASGIAGVDTFFQNTGNNDLFLYFGGTSAPTDPAGIILNPGEAFNGTSSHIWAKGDGATSISFVSN